MKKILLLSLLAVIAFGASAQDGFKKYGVKSFIAKTQTTAGGQVTDGTLYVDDYGAFECDIKKMDVPGFITYDYGVITRKDRIWTFNINEGKVQYKESANPMPDLNFLNVTDEMAQKYDIQDLGEEECMGKTCHKYSYVVLQGRKNKKVYWTVWAWKGIPMKYVIQQGRQESTVETVDLQLDAKIPDNILHLIE